MAEAPKTSEVTESNSVLTRSLSNMLYVDRLNSLIEKYEKKEDKSGLLSEAADAMQACLSLQEFMNGDFVDKGDRGTQSLPSKAVEDLKVKDKNEKLPSSPRQLSSEESILEIVNPSVLDDEEVEVDGGHVKDEVHMGSDKEKSLQEINPSLHSTSSNSGMLSKDLEKKKNSLGIESQKQDAIKEHPTEDEIENDGLQNTGTGRSKTGSVISLEAVNPSSDFKSKESSDGRGRSKTGSVISLEAVNPSSDFKSKESSDGRGSSELMEDDSQIQNDASPSGDSAVDDPANQGDNNLTDRISRSKFNVTLKPTSLTADEFTTINMYCSSKVKCAFFNEKTCHYTIPVNGSYKFIARKLGNENFQCCIRKDDGKIANQANTKWKRGTAKVDVTWACTAGQIVWIEGKGQTEDCGIAVIFSGSLLEC